MEASSQFGYSTSKNFLRWAFRRLHWGSRDCRRTELYYRPQNRKYVAIREKQSMDEEIENFLSRKRAAINASNEEEFIDTEKNIGYPTRNRTLIIEKSTHIKSSVVDNQDGPLSRSIICTTNGKLISPHVRAAEGGENKAFNALEDSVRNIETHVGIVIAPLDKSLAERVKILEEKILRIEQFYPQIAAHAFNYGEAEMEASFRPGGRVSKVPGSERNDNQQKKKKGKLNEASQNPSNSGDSFDDLKKRLAEVKLRLLKKNK